MSLQPYVIHLRNGSALGTFARDDWGAFGYALQAAEAGMPQPTYVQVLVTAPAPFCRADRRPVYGQSWSTKGVLA